MHDFRAFFGLNSESENKKYDVQPELMGVLTTVCGCSMRPNRTQAPPSQMAA